MVLFSYLLALKVQNCKPSNRTASSIAFRANERLPILSPNISADWYKDSNIIGSTMRARKRLKYFRRIMANIVWNTEMMRRTYRNDCKLKNETLKRSVLACTLFIQRNFEL